MVNGRPEKYSKEYLPWAEGMVRVGATEKEIDEFFSSTPSIDECAARCLAIIREDRKGASAHRKGVRARWKKQKALSDISWRVENSTRARIHAALKGRTRGSLIGRLDYSVQDLMRHLEGLFVEGMSWDNYGKWHIDHIIPCCKFDHSDDNEFKQCWSLENLQPLWARDNIRKGARND